MRDPVQRTARNEFHDAWEANVQQAQAMFGDITDGRTRVLLLNGPPDERVESNCSLILVPAEVWFYAPSHHFREPFVVVLYRKWGAGPFRLWEPGEGIDVLFSGESGPLGDQHSLGEIASPGDNGCGDDEHARKILAGIDWVLGQGADWIYVQQMIDQPPKPPGAEWVSTFNSYSTDVPAGAPPLPAKLELAFPGRLQSRTMVQGVVTVPPGAAGQARLGEARSYNLLLNGEVLATASCSTASATSSTCRLRRPPRTALPSDPARLRAPPAARRLHADRQGGGRQLRPLLPRRAPLERAGDGDRGSRGLRAAHARGGRGAPRPGRGRRRPALGRDDDQADAAARRAAGRHAALRHPDHRPRHRPGHLPARRQAGADQEGAALQRRAGPRQGAPHPHRSASPPTTRRARSWPRTRSQINATGNRFRVHLVEPQKGKRYESSLLARAEVDVPEGETLERVELYLNEAKIATLYQPP